MYVYKLFDLDQAMESFHRRHPEYEEACEALAAVEEDMRQCMDEHLPIYEELLHARDHYEDVMRRASHYMPWEESFAVEPGVVYLDVVTGPPTAQKLLLHTTVPNHFPRQVLWDIISSNKKKHINRGPYYHMLQINIYPENIKTWGSNFHKLEVDLWQDVTQNVVTEAEQAVEAARIPVRQTRVCRY